MIYRKSLVRSRRVCLSVILAAAMAIAEPQNVPRPPQAQHLPPICGTISVSLISTKDMTVQFFGTLAACRTEVSTKIYHQVPRYARSCIAQGRFALGFYQQKAADRVAREAAKEKNESNQLGLFTLLKGSGSMNRFWEQPDVRHQSALTVLPALVNVTNAKSQWLRSRCWQHAASRPINTQSGPMSLKTLKPWLPQAARSAATHCGTHVQSAAVTRQRHLANWL